MARQRIFLVVGDHRSLAYLSDRAGLRRDLTAEGIGATDLLCVQLLGSPGRQLLPPTPRYRDALEHLPTFVDDPGACGPGETARVASEVRTAALYLAEDGVDPAVVVIQLGGVPLGDLLGRLGVPVEGVRPVAVAPPPARPPARPPAPAGPAGRDPLHRPAYRDQDLQQILARARQQQSTFPPLSSYLASSSLPPTASAHRTPTLPSDARPGRAALAHAAVTAAVLVGALILLPGIGLRALYDRGAFDLFGGFPLPYVLVVTGVAVLAAAILGGACASAAAMAPGPTERASVVAGGVFLTVAVGVAALALCFGPPALVLGAEHLLVVVRPEHHDWSHRHWNAGTWWVFVLAVVAVGSLISIPVRRYNFDSTGFSWFLLVGSTIAGAIVFFTAVPG